MVVAFYVMVALGGLGVGVVVNALADRISGDEEPPWVAGHCRTCGTPLPAARYIPFLNLRASRRQCPSCGTTASLRRPLVELALAVLYPLLLTHLLVPENAGRIAPWAIFLLDALIFAVLAFVFSVDLEHHLIYSLSVFAPAALLVLVALITDRKALASMLIGTVICAGLFLLLYGLGFLLYRVEALGLGDVQLAVLIGIFVGWQGVITSLVLAALFGAAIGLVILGTREESSHTYMPYGTVMSIGAILAILMVRPLW